MMLLGDNINRRCQKMESDGIFPSETESPGTSPDSPGDSHGQKHYLWGHRI